MKTCNHLMRCWDLTIRPCLRDAGHTPGHHNPFGNSYPFDEDPVMEHISKLPAQLFLKQEMELAEV